jgi:plastocyanin
MIAPGPAFEPNEIRVRPGGWVFWWNHSGQSAGVTFDDPTNVIEPTPVCNAFETSPDFAFVIPIVYPGGFPCGSGNIPPFHENIVDPPVGDTYSFRIRQFPVAGVYNYRDPVTGATGRVVVTDG